MHSIEINSDQDQIGANSPPVEKKETVKGPPAACLFVASLSPETTEATVRKFFQEQGEVLKIKILKDKSARPYAFVQYRDVDDALAALHNTNNKVLDGRRLRVEKAKVNRTLFIAKMDKNLTNNELKEIVETYGPTESVIIIKNYHTNKSKGCGFVKFHFREDAMDAFLGLKNHSQHKWIIEWATSENDPDNLGIDRTHLFVGGLHPSITKKQIEEKFSKFGELANVTLINKDTEREEQSIPRSCFAFVRYQDSTSSMEAIEQENGAVWMNRRIRVQYCESQEMKNKRKNAKYPSNFVPATYYQPMYMMGGPPPPAMGPGPQYPPNSMESLNLFPSDPYHPSMIPSPTSPPPMNYYYPPMNVGFSRQHNGPWAQFPGHPPSVEHYQVPQTMVFQNQVHSQNPLSNQQEGSGENEAFGFQNLNLG